MSSNRAQRLTGFTIDGLIAEVRRRIELASLQEAQPRDPAPVPAWASYFTGYRDALHELLEQLDDK